ncbi:YbjN domain-containing protein [Oscillospiraceae bacterium OttesenSCG-928-G22]|nr:YbjN domain-containing protein [Oscillospiraceae bacterium OttesenSCG-928-G22]
MSANEKLTNQIYKTVQDILDELEIKYNKDPERYSISFTYGGDDMSHQLIIYLRPEAAVLRMFVMMPFDIDPARAGDILEACARINNVLTAGEYLYDMKDTVTFGMSQFYINSIISRELIEHMLRTTVNVVEDFDDRLAAVNKGYLKPSEILKGIVE